MINHRIYRLEAWRDFLHFFAKKFLFVPIFIFILLTVQFPLGGKKPIMIIVKMALSAKRPEATFLVTLFGLSFLLLVIGIAQVVISAKIKKLKKGEEP